MQKREIHGFNMWPLHHSSFPIVFCTCNLRFNFSQLDILTLTLSNRGAGSCCCTLGHRAHKTITTVLILKYYTTFFYILHFAIHYNLLQNASDQTNIFRSQAWFLPPTHPHPWGWLPVTVVGSHAHVWMCEMYPVQVDYLWQIYTTSLG